eukprot:m.71100 g.71100  ORF g.71100 m.71100 type:complete len:197 (-) comp11694_c0_seq2:2207-2797(-)
MTSGYLERFLERVDGLPEELHRSYNLLRELDQETKDAIEKVDLECQTFLHKIQRLAKEERQQQLQQIKNAFEKILEYSDQKYNITLQSYEEVDEHIRALDADMKSFQEEARNQSGIDDNGLYSEDLPVDPNEPTYCFCHQVSFGEMIACDNPSCPIEWFHFSCVNLTSPPENGHWLCPSCEASGKKKLTDVNKFST